MLSGGMFASTFALGYMPLTLNCSKTALDAIAIYGAGLLVGAALFIIIPEGLMVLISACTKEKSQLE